MTADDVPDRLGQKSVRRIAWGLAGLTVVITWGTFGYVWLGWPVDDALYMVVITLSTVGYGEVRPINSGWLRLHTMLTILFGYVSVGYTITGILGFIAEEELQRFVGQHRVRRQIDALRGHVIVTGLGRIGSLVCTELAEAGEPFVLIDQSPEKVGMIESRGWLYIIGDATEEKVLEDAGLLRARALVMAIPSDAVNVFIALTAREMAPKVQIIARAEDPGSPKKLRQAGADHVVLPTAIGAQRIASILTNPSAVKFTELVTHRSSLAIEMADVDVQDPGAFVGRSLRDLDIGRRTGVMVIAVKRADGVVQFPPPGDEPFVAGDVIVVLGRPANLEQFRAEYGG
jgi:voltage-gated potassium channel